MYKRVIHILKRTKTKENICQSNKQFLHLFKLCLHVKQLRIKNQFSFLKMSKKLIVIVLIMIVGCNNFSNSKNSIS